MLPNKFTVAAATGNTAVAGTLVSLAQLHFQAHSALLVLQLYQML